MAVLIISVSQSVFYYYAVVCLCLVLWDKHAVLYPFESHRVTQLVCAYPITNIFFSAFFCSFLLIKLYQDFLWATSSFLIIFLLNNSD